jgi:hypothetical protein
LIEHIFFRKKIKEKEFQARMEVEELVRYHALDFKGVDRRRLKTSNRKKYY